MSTASEAEFLLRSLAIDMLEICEKADITLAEVKVMPNNSFDESWWHVSFVTKGNESVFVKVEKHGGCDDVEE